MKDNFRWVMALGAVVCLLGVSRSRAAVTDGAEEAPQPHTPTLIFYLSGLQSSQEGEAVRAAVGKLKSARLVDVNTKRGFARVRFDSHVVSYHEVGQAIADAGATVGKRFEPRLILSVPDYSRTNNAARVEKIFAGKRLNSRVKVKALDRDKGKFLVFLLPLKPDATAMGPQGFNGGHLHHPISDPPPRGLGLPCSYAAEDDATVAVDPR